MTNSTVEALMTELASLARTADGPPGAEREQAERRLQRVGRKHVEALATAVVAVRRECECYGGAEPVDAVLGALVHDLQLQPDRSASAGAV